MHEVPQIILQQLGGHRFIAMTGATQFIGGASTLTFALPARSTRNKANKCRITLNGRDLYDMEFFKVGARNCTSLGCESDVYAEDLQAIFTRVTGLDTHL